MNHQIAPTKTRPGDQPLPQGGRECVQDALIAEIERRKQLGIERYGSPLMTHNGRSAVQDAREEAVDLAVYLMQVELEDRDRKDELAALRREVAAARKFAGEMRDFCSPHGVAAGYADQLEAAMDRAKGEHRDAAADTLAAEWHRRHQRLEELTKSKGPEAQVAIVEHVRGELVGLRGALGVLLGGQVQGGTADLLGWSYYQEWRRRQGGKA